MQWTRRALVLVLSYLVITDSPLLARPQGASAQEQDLDGLLKAGEASFLEGDYKEAIRAFSKAYELSDSRSMMALRGLGTAYLRLSKFDTAQKYGERILELGVTEADQAAAENLIGAAFLGRALDSQSERTRPELLAEAESHLRASLDLSSGQMSIAWLSLSTALQEQDRLEEALGAQQEYVNRTPEGRPGRVRLCKLQYLAQQVDRPVAKQQETEETPLQTPLKIEGNVLPPQKIYGPQPLYTEEARRERVQGVVILETVIDKEGNITNVKVLKGLPLGLTESAVLTACQWQFEPATLHGEPVATYFNLTTRFSLGKQKKDVVQLAAPRARPFLCSAPVRPYLLNPVYGHLP